MTIIELIKQFFDSLFGGKSDKGGKKNEDSSTKTSDENPVIQPNDNSPSKPKNNMEKSKKLYSLIVGINENNLAYLRVAVPRSQVWATER